MSLYDYKMSQKIAAEDFPFYALVMALVRQADSSNMELLTSAWPEVVAELKARYNSPGGILPEDRIGEAAL